MDKEIELLNCPFCGGEAYIIEDDPIFWVRCNSLTCGVCSKTMPCGSRAKAIKEWNTRYERTCTVEGYDTGYEWDIDDTYYQVDDPKFTLSCGHEAYGSVEPNFCPVCGARVIEDE